MKPDAETKQELTDAEALKQMTDTRGWGIARESLVNRILDLQNINNVDTTSIETMSVDLKARKMAADMLFVWLKSDVEGRIEQQENTAAALLDKDKDDFVQRS